MIVRQLTFCSALSLIIGVSSNASSLAQSSTGSADAAGSTSQGLEEIIVTARKREEKLQTVPVAITALTQAKIDQEQVRDVGELAHLVPSLDINSIYRDQGGGSIRGLSGVVTYFADIPTPPPLGQGGGGTVTGGIGTYYDLSNVQVLSGPQGTLFGLAATGGAILFEPKHPQNDFEGYAKITLGNYNEHGFEGAINVPIVDDKLLVRFAGQGEQRDGFTTVATGPHAGVDLDNRDYFAWRLGITARPSDDFENYLLYWGVNSSTNGSSLILKNVNAGQVFGEIPLGPLGNVPLTLANGPAYTGLLNPATAVATAIAGYKAGAFSLYPELIPALAAQQALGPRQQFGLGAAAEAKIYYWNVSDTATWDLGDDFSIKNLASYSEYSNYYPSDYTGTGLPILATISARGPGSMFVSDELQFHGKALADKLTWVAGGFLDYTGSTAGLSKGTLLTFGAPQTSYGGNSGRTQALFAQADYDLGDLLQGLRFTAGYRYTWDWRSSTSIVVGGATNAIDKQFHAPGWTLDLDYQIFPQTMVYVRGAKAYTSGAFNNGFPPGDSRAIVQPSYYTEAEIGLKSDWTIGGVQARTNVAAFHGSYENIQEGVSLTLQNPTRVVSATLNAASATIEGVEFEGTVIPFPSLEITANYQYIYGSYDTFFIPNPSGFGPPIDASNRPISEIPKNKFSITARYQLPVDDGIGKVFASATYAWQGHNYLSADQEPGALLPSYGTLNVRMDWQDAFGYPLDVGFFMTNVLDTTYQVGFFPLYYAIGLNNEIYAPPRMWGFELKYRFDDKSEPESAPAAYIPPPVQAPAQPLPKSYLVFFDFARSDLTQQATDIVDEAAKNAGSSKVTQLTVTGHTDTVGSDAYNMRLSRRRAESVSVRLEHDGIPASEIEIIAKGKRDPLVPTGDGVREPQNRRVQIVYSVAAGS